MSDRHHAWASALNGPCPVSKGSQNEIYNDAINSRDAGEPCGGQLSEERISLQCPAPVRKVYRVTYSTTADQSVLQEDEEMPRPQHIDLEAQAHRVLRRLIDNH
jgi:hypothetical protein